MGLATVRIASLASGGDGVGRLPDGRAVFVPRTAPGDLVEVGGLDVRRTFARGRAVRVVEPSPDRTDPRCVHFAADDCGGCAWQHLAYGAQVRAKAGIVRDALERIARTAVGEVEVVANPRPWGWRSRLTLSVDARTGAAGLRRLGRPDDVFPVVRCEIASAGVQRLWDALRDRVRDLPGRCERVTLREDAAGGLHVVAHGAAAWPRAGAVASALAAAGVSATLWVLPDGGRAVVVGGAAPAAGATAFEQVDAAMGEIVRRHAVAALGPVRGLRAWDLYAGTGATTALLAGAGASVESVECDADAVAEARRRGPADGVTRHAARVEDALPGLGGADVAVVNPPRSGLGPQVADELVARPPGRVAYVSCDPATLARDVARMAPAYRLESVRGFDSFPQTAHVETVAVLVRP